MVTVSKDGCLRGWDVFERKKISKLILDKEKLDSPKDEEQQNSDRDKEAFDPLNLVECCIFNQKTVFCGYSDGSIYAWNMKSGELIYKYQGHEDKVSSMEWIDPNTFVSSSYDQTLVFWDCLVRRDGADCLIALEWGRDYCGKV